MTLSPDVEPGPSAMEAPEEPEGPEESEPVELLGADGSLGPFGLLFDEELLWCE
jgi:hypothetical protein